jgi:hypothetical protein
LFQKKDREGYKKPKKKKKKKARKNDQRGRENNG